MGRAIAPESALLAKFFVRGETAYRLARRKNPRAKLLLHHNFVKGIFRPSERALGTWIMLLTILVLLVALAVGADAATVSVRTTGLAKAYRSRASISPPGLDAGRLRSALSDVGLDVTRDRAMVL